MKRIDITADLITYVPGPFGPAQYSAGRKTFSDIDSFRAACRNANDVLARSGAYHITLDIDVGLAVLVSGYNDDRGMYCDVVPLEELQPYLS